MQVSHVPTSEYEWASVQTTSAIKNFRAKKNLNNKNSAAMSLVYYSYLTDKEPHSEENRRFIPLDICLKLNHN